MRVKKLCMIFLSAVLGVMLTSCAWLYQVTGVECFSSMDSVTESSPAEIRISDNTVVNTEELSIFREGCYSNGSYIMELIGIDNTQEGGYQLVVCTPQYGIRMFTGFVQNEEANTESFVVSDNDDPNVTLTVDVSRDGQTLLVSYCEEGVENAYVSGMYTYYEQENHAQTEASTASAFIAEGEYSCKGYHMTVVYESDHIRVEIVSPLGNTLLGASQTTQIPLQTALFKGDWGSAMLVAAGDGSGSVVVTGRGDSDRALQYAGTYTLS